MPKDKKISIETQNAVIQKVGAQTLKSGILGSNLALLLTSYKTLDKSFNITMPWFPHDKK